MEKYLNRKQAGQLLSKHCQAYKEAPNTAVLALPRGGVPVAYEIAKRLSLPLDVFLVRKLGLPGAQETAMGAIASGGVTIFNQNILNQYPITASEIKKITQSETQALQQREKIYYRTHQPLELQQKTIILVDDGVATGATVKAAVQAIRAHHPAKLILAVPVAAQDTAYELAALVDEWICPLTPSSFYAVGYWYESFQQVSDEEVVRLLHASVDGLREHPNTNNKN